MFRPLFGALVLALSSAAAVAAEPKGDACILTATEAITAPKKPALTVLKLDCGTTPTVDQQKAAAAIAAKANIADGLQYLVGAGYDLKGSTTLIHYSGRSVISLFTFVKGAGVAAAVTEEADGLEDLPDAPDTTEQIP